MRLETTTSRAGAFIVALAAAGALLAACDPAPDPTPSSGESPTTIATPTLESTTETTTPDPPPPFIDHVQWVQTDVGTSLQVYPTPAGRQASAQTAMPEAWREVLALAPTADTPSMKAQFDCHWTFARLVDPEKTSWNLEPARPVVTSDEMIAARCNPGGAEEGPTG